MVAAALEDDVRVSYDSVAEQIDEVVGDTLEDEVLDFDVMEGRGVYCSGAIGTDELVGAV